MSLTLISAASAGYIVRFRKILDSLGKRININFQDGLGWTALIAAAKNGHHKIVKLLLERDDIDINFQNEYGDTALIWASRGGHFQVVNLLLNCKIIDVNVENDPGNTALIEACHGLYTRIVRQLLKCKMIDVNFQNNHGSTALTWALRGRGRYVEGVISMLLERQDIYLLGKDGETGLLRAAHYCRKKAVESLVRRGVSISSRIIDAAYNLKHPLLAHQLIEWSNDGKMLSNLSLQRRCWLTILIHRIKYAEPGGIPPIISHIHNVIWLGSFLGTEDSFAYCEMRKIQHLQLLTKSKITLEVSLLCSHAQVVPTPFLIEKK